MFVELTYRIWITLYKKVHIFAIFFPISTCFIIHSMLCSFHEVSMLVRESIAPASQSCNWHRGWFVEITLTNINWPTETQTPAGRSCPFKSSSHTYTSRSASDRVVAGSQLILSGGKTCAINQASMLESRAGSSAAVGLLLQPPLFCC